MFWSVLPVLREINSRRGAGKAGNREVVRVAVRERDRVQSAGPLDHCEVAEYPEDKEELTVTVLEWICQMR